MSTPDIEVTPLRRSRDQTETQQDAETFANPFNVEAEIESLDNLADWLDSKFEIPGTGIRFGLDPIFGLLPGIGDTLSAIPAGHIILTAQRLGAPTHVILRMLGNVGIDAVIGFVPMLGDLLDVSFKANRRNVALLREHFNIPTNRRL